jgi:hypothetical protein
MADSSKKHPAHEKLDEFEDLLNREPKPKPKELRNAAAKLETDLTDQLVFKNSQEDEARAIRERLAVLLESIPGNNEIKSVRTTVKRLIGKIEIKETAETNPPTQTDDGHNGPGEEKAQADEYAEVRKLLQRAREAVIKFPAGVTVADINQELKISYAETSLLMELMEREGIVGPDTTDGHREVFIKTNPPAQLDDKSKKSASATTANRTREKTPQPAKPNPAAPSGKPQTPKQPEISDKDLQKMAERVAPKEYKKWCDIFQALHYSDLPTPEDGNFIKRITGIEDGNEYKRAKNALWQNGFKKYLETENPARALNEIFSDVELNDKNIAQKINDKIEEIKRITEAVKRKTPPPAEAPAPASQSTRGPKTPGPISVSTDTKPKEVKQEIKNNPLFRKRMETGTDEEKAFFTAVEAYLSTKSGDVKLFADALQLLEIGDAYPWASDLQARVKKLFAQKQAILKRVGNSPQPIIALFEEGLRPLQKEMREFEDREFYTTFASGALEERFTKVYEMAGTNLNDIKDLRKRKHFQEMQEEIRLEIEGIKKDFPVASLRALRLPDRKVRAAEISKRIDVLNEFITYFEEEILPDLPQKTQKLYRGAFVTISTATTPAVTTPSSSGATGAPTASSATVAPGASPSGTPPLSPTPAPPAKPKPLIAPKKAPSAAPNVYGSIDEETGLSASVQKMLEAILTPKELIKANLPVCRAIDRLIRSKNMNVRDLQKILTNPEFLKKTIDKDIMILIGEEMTRLKINPNDKDAYDKLRKALEKEKINIQKGIDNIKLKNKGIERKITAIQANRGSTKALTDPEKEEIKTLNEELNKNEKRIQNHERSGIARIEKIFGAIDTLSKLEKLTAIYKSPREVLGMINIYLAKDDETVETLQEKIEQQVQDERERMRPNLFVATVGKLFLPSLKSTLKALSKDKKMAELLGENAGDELAKLSFLFGSNYDKVSDWASNLPGGIEKHIETTIPRLIAYLELATRDGKARYLVDTAEANNLIIHLRKLQHEHIRDKIDEEGSMEPRLKMLKYVEKINESERKITDLNKTILKNNMAKNIAIKGGAIAGLAGSAILSPFSFLSTLPAFLSAPAFIASYTNRVPKKRQPMVRSAAIRATIANGVVLGGIALGAGLYIGSGLALIGLASPNLIGLASPNIGKKIWKRVIGETDKKAAA